MDRSRLSDHRRVDRGVAGSEIHPTGAGHVGASGCGRPRLSAAPGGRCIDRSVDTGHLAGLDALVVTDPEFHSGFGPRADQSIAHELLGYLAAQLGRSPELYRDYSRRPQTRTDHPLKLAALRGLRVPARDDVPMMVELAVRGSRI
ncbi:MAG: DUF4158 domain-containing protein [Mesorhizobium sp.]|nr:MAG: DUF4158 domain-containing protein [Mesorhizobium sp.]